jgi:hypothetical protein
MDNFISSFKLFINRDDMFSSDEKGFESKEDNHHSYSHRYASIDVLGVLNDSGGLEPSKKFSIGHIGLD